MLRTAVTALVLLGVSDFPLQAQPKPKVVSLTVLPAKAPLPALKYLLLPEVRDLKSGNALLLYYRANSPDWNPQRREKDYSKIYELLEIPLAKLPRDKVILPTHALAELDRAARCAYCDWDLTERIREDALGVLLPELQSFREFAVLLSLRARLQMLDRQWGPATETLQTGFAMSRHIAEGPTLIHGLVGLAIASIMIQHVEQLIELPGAPNLHWALVNLPRPFIDLRKAYQGERLMVDSLFPDVRRALRDPKAPPLTSDQMQKFFSKMTALEGPKDKTVGGFAGLGASVGMAVFAATIYPEAKAFLVEMGRAPAEVDKLPVVQLAWMYMVGEYDRYYDEMAKWHNLPYWEAAAGIKKVEAILAKKSQFVGGTLARLLLPAVQKVMLAQHRLDRRLAALRLVEALRLHAAEHDGALPPSLEALAAELPVPLDPITGKNFDYQVKGVTAIVSAPPPAGEPAHEGNALSYEITLTPPAQKK